MALARVLRGGSATFHAWVVLGLIAISVGVSLLEVLARWPAGLELPSSPIGYPMLGVNAIVVYALLMLGQPRFLPWPRWRIVYLVGVFGITLLTGLAAPPLFRLRNGIAAYGVLAHARVTLGKNGGRLVGAMLVLATLLDMGLFTLVWSGRLLTERAPAPALAPFGFWLAGLIFVQIFTGLGVEERAARLRSEELIKELTEVQGQLRAYAVRAEELATVRERTRVARELHDTLAQGLAAIKMLLETGGAVFPERPELARQHMERARALAGEHLQQARTSILALRSDALGGQPLPLALAALAAAWRPGQGIGSEPGGAIFHASDIARRAQFPATLELACYRVTQEALTNAAVHGCARHADVELSLEADELCLTITDDGMGFDPAAPRASGAGFGIIGMQERVRLLNGRLDVISAPGTGTQVVVMLPLEAARDRSP